MFPIGSSGLLLLNQSTKLQRGKLDLSKLRHVPRRQMTSAL
jgi:hypothetical protein